MSNNNTDQQSLSYRDAGVDIDAGNTLVERIKPAVKRTMRPEVMGGLGGFGGLFELAQGRYTNPVLVSGTDGVGTKLKLAMQMQKHDTIGIDLVAMCVNDILVQGAEPLFFLDYYATGQLDVDVAEAVIQGIAKGCELSGAALIGGETAEMPGMYTEGDYDLAGFCVGIAEKDHLITGDQVKAGDVLIGLASSGPHSNGYSLIRKIIELSNADLNMTFADSTLGETLLSPTRIYVKSILQVIQQHPINSICHITGGGILENLPRVLPPHAEAIIDLSSWQPAPIFGWLAKSGNIEQQEMLRTFNCGIGLVLCVNALHCDAIMQALRDLGEQAYQIGYIDHTDSKAPKVTISKY